jgi:hypothetical protein
MAGLKTIISAFELDLHKIKNFDEQNVEIIK